jgi:hypothetical protein
MMICVDKYNKVGFESLEIQFDKKLKIIRTNKEHLKELARPKFKSLREDLIKN